MDQDPFTHLPHLRARLTPADQSRVRFTREALAALDGRARAMGFAPDWRHSDERIEASWRRLVPQERQPGDLWVFAYGSLMWDPGIHFTEVRIAHDGGDRDPARRRHGDRLRVRHVASTVRGKPSAT